MPMLLRNKMRPMDLGLYVRSEAEEQRTVKLLTPNLLFFSSNKGQNLRCFGLEPEGDHLRVHSSASYRTDLPVQRCYGNNSSVVPP